MFLIIFNMFFACSSYESFIWGYNNWYNIFTFRAIFSSIINDSFKERSFVKWFYKLFYISMERRYLV